MFMLSVVHNQWTDADPCYDLGTRSSPTPGPPSLEPARATMTTGEPRTCLAAVAGWTCLFLPTRQQATICSEPRSLLSTRVSRWYDSCSYVMSADHGLPKQPHPPVVPSSTCPATRSPSTAPHLLRPPCRPASASPVPSRPATPAS